MRRFVGGYVFPALLLLLVAVLPLVLGRKTLCLRDVLNTHLEMKSAEAEALREARLPLLDPYRAGGQPLLGNPNAVALHPDNVLYLIAPLFWALNAHFWLHLLVAPCAMYALGRAWGLGREASWAAGVCYAACGFFLSTMSFYNLIAGAALTPALVAACLWAARGKRAAPVAAGLVWALLLLSGEPFWALLAILLAAGAVGASGRIGGGGEEIERPPMTLARLAWGLGCGTLLAAPQLVELARILPLSFRGHYGYSPASVLVESFDPRQAAEWLLPFLFGRPDLLGPGSFWGAQFFTGKPAYFFTLYPGLLALGLVVASGRPRSRAAVWAWIAASSGLFFALGRFNPIAAWLLGTAAALRYPVKFWLLVAVGMALLCGIGFERAIAGGEEAARRRLGWALASLATGLAGLWAALALLPVWAEAVLRRILPSGVAPAALTNERLRWAGLCLVSLVVLGALAASLRFARRSPFVGGALLLAIHLAAQLWFLRPALATDEIAPYLQAPPLLAELPPSSRAVHGAFLNLFGPSTLGAGTYPAAQARELERRAFAEFYPFAGALSRRRFEMNASPEGLDSFLARFAQAAIEQGEDRNRIRLLAVWGIDRLFMNRELADDTGARLLRRAPSFGQEILVYEILQPAPPALLAGRIVRAPDLGAALQAMVDPGFDRRASVVLPGAGPAAEGPAGSARIVTETVESMEADVESAAPGVLVLQRSHLPIYRATVDGEEARIVAANVYRLGIEVPAGRHRVRVWVDRGPLHLSLAAAAAGLCGLLVLSLARRRAVVSQRA